MSRWTVRQTTCRLACASMLLCALGLGCSKAKKAAPDEAPPATPQANSPPKDTDKARIWLDGEFPLHGLVTGVHLVVREEPRPDARLLGWVRMGARLRFRDETQKTETCASGWRPLHPRGWLCTGEGIEVGPTPPSTETPVEPPDADSALPYRYYFIKEERVPEYHRLPSRDEQRAAKAYAARLGELLEADKSRKAELFAAGKLRGEPMQPAVVGRNLDRGFYVAGNGIEVRAFRRFIRTASGSYVKEARTEERSGSSFAGVKLDDKRTLPIAFALRAARPMIKIDKDDGTHKLKDDPEAEVIERQTVVESWSRRQRVGDHIYHLLGEDRYVRSWFIGVAEKMEPPFELTSDDEPWVHVDISEQTLVVYRGTRPIFATLVSSGLDEHDTPRGVFTIQRKIVSDTMADLGPDAGDDRYRIEDVPWTQYFDGSVALHGAFWHNRFGLQRSHGCVNLAPRDARTVFQNTWPEVPEGWHGVSTEGTGFRGSRVVVTD